MRVRVAGPFQFDQLQRCTGPQFDQFYALYAEAIAARERKPEAWICEMSGSADYRVLLLQRDRQVIGFSVLFLPPREDFGVLEYMAVASQYRNAGLGTELFRRSLEIARQAWQSQPSSLLLEVDSDREDSPDRAVRRLRLQFYRRLGCLAIAGLHYILPLPGVGPPPEMELLVYRQPTRPDMRSQVPKSEVARWLKTIYQKIYRCSPDDPRIQQMLSQLPDPVPLA